MRLLRRAREQVLGEPATPRQPRAHLPAPGPFHSPIKPPMLPVTNTRPERRRFMSGRKAWSIRTVPTTFTSSTEPTSSSKCSSSGPSRPRPALHTVGTEAQSPTLPASYTALCSNQSPRATWASGTPWCGHRVGEEGSCMCVSGRLTQHVHMALSHTCPGCGHRICILHIQLQCLQGARRAPSGLGRLPQRALLAQVPECGIHWRLGERMRI